MIVLTSRSVFNISLHVVPLEVVEILVIYCYMKQQNYNFVKTTVLAWKPSSSDIEIFL